MAKEQKRLYAKTPTIYQMEATECGAASLAMILGYFGCFVPLEQMRIETGVSRDGCNAKNIMRAGRKFGLEVHGYRVPEDVKVVGCNDMSVALYNNRPITTVRVISEQYPR